MTRSLKSTLRAGMFISAFAVLLPLNAAAAGQGVGEGEGIVTQLGARGAAVTYWVARPQGWDVVTTIDPLAGDDNDGQAIVRFSSRLLPGQSQVISVPAAIGRRYPSLVIRRNADRIEVETTPVPED